MKKIIKKMMPKIIYKLISKIFKVLPFYVFRMFKIQPNKIIFDNFGGKGYGDNPKYIAEEIIKQKLNYDIVWLTESGEKEGFPHQIRAVKTGSLKAIFELSTAKVWIDNSRKPSNVRKRKHQYYIQTWHGGNPIKKVEKDAESSLPIQYILDAKNDSKMADLFISNSEFTTQRYLSSFWYNGQILQCGSPRNDVLINKDNHSHVNEKVRKKFKIKPETKIMLYTPTFRSHGNLDVYLDEYDRVLKSLEKKFGGNWIAFVRLHPNISNKSKSLKLFPNILDLSKYDDLQELMVISDIMITDFSSAMFDFALTHKPVFQYVKDLEDYKRERDFVIDIFSLPFSIAQTINELILNINDFNKVNYDSNVTSWFNSVGSCEYGRASFDIVEQLKTIMEE